MISTSSQSSYLLKLPQELITCILVFSTCPNARLQARATCKKFKELIDEAAKNELYSRRIECQIQSSIANNQLADALYAYTLLLINNAPLLCWETIEALGSTEVGKALRHKVSIKALKLLNLSEFIATEGTIERLGQSNPHIVFTKIDAKLHQLKEGAHFNSFKLLLIYATLALTQTKTDDFELQRKNAYSALFCHVDRLLANRSYEIISPIILHLKQIELDGNNGLKNPSKRFLKQLKSLAQQSIIQKIKPLTDEIEDIFVQVALNAHDLNVKNYALKRLMNPLFNYNALLSNDALQQMIRASLYEKNEKLYLFNKPLNTAYRYCNDLTLCTLKMMAEKCEPLRQITVEILKKIAQWKIENASTPGFLAHNWGVLCLLKEIVAKDALLKQEIFFFIKSLLPNNDITEDALEFLKQIALTNVTLRQNLATYLKNQIGPFNSSLEEKQIQQRILTYKYFLALEKNPDSLTKANIISDLQAIMNCTCLINTKIASLKILKRVALLEENKALVDYFKNLFINKGMIFEDVLLDHLTAIAIKHQNLRQGIIYFLKKNLTTGEEYYFDLNNKLLKSLEKINRM